MGMVPFVEVALIDGQWYFAWAAGLGAVRVVLRGSLLTETTDHEFFYAASSLYASLTMAPPLEVVQTDDLVWSDGRPLLWADGESILVPGGTDKPPAVSEKNPPYLLLQWYRVPCHHYQIEFKNGSAWTFFSTVTDNQDVFIQTFTTPLLPDEEESFWRVIAINSNKRESLPVGFRTMVVRPPDAPAAPVLACFGGVLHVQ